MNAEQLRKFNGIVVAMHLHQTRIWVTTSHLAGDTQIDQGPDVLGLPDGHTGPKLVAGGWAAQFDAKPPAALADGQGGQLVQGLKKDGQSPSVEIQIDSHDAAPCKVFGAVLSGPGRLCDRFWVEAKPISVCVW